MTIDELGTIIQKAPHNTAKAAREFPKALTEYLENGGDINGSVGKQVTRLINLRFIA